MTGHFGRHGGRVAADPAWSNGENARKLARASQ